jgi:preprotein translocase subunit SecY
MPTTRLAHCYVLLLLLLLLTCCAPGWLQALLRAFELEPYALITSHFIIKTCITLMAGSSILQFIANTITAHGIGNGTTLVIVTSIVSGVCCLCC